MSKITQMLLKGLCLSLLLSSKLTATYECCEPFGIWDGCPNRFIFGAEYLYWKIKDSPNPIPLVVTAPFADNMLPLIGVPGTEVLLGDKDIRNNWRSGGRFTLGWFNEDCCIGAEANYFFFPSGSKSQSVASSGSPSSIYLSVPYFDTFTNLESSSPLAEPGRFRALAKLRVSNQFQGAEVNGTTVLFCNCSYKVNALAGFRYLNFYEKLKFSVDSPAVAIPAEIFQVTDRFKTKNNFYGGQIGLIGEFWYNQFFINAKGKLAIGAMQEDVKIKGKFITNAFNGFGAAQTFEGGYFALLSNMGRHRKTCFAVVPEVNLNIGYQVFEGFRIQLGYTFLYVNKMAWAGKQINRNINPTQSSLYEFTPTPTLTGQASPRASVKSSSFWAQGLNVSLEFQY